MAWLCGRVRGLVVCLQSTGVLLAELRKCSYDTFFGARGLNGVGFRWEEKG
jgi:hypothetical protein